MKTKYLDNEIEKLNLLERNEKISDYGIDMLAEFKEIKQALTIPVVVGRSEQLKAFRKWWNKDNEGVCTTITNTDIERYLESL